MAKNKNQKQPAKQQARSSGQDTSRSSDSPEQSSHAPSPMDLAHKSKQKKFGHN
ncbi:MULTISPECIES: hypothetical protein [Streptomyces]|uniref:Small acid-soluble spore protein P (Minor) n=1 Tax=Streptomyces yangpuensis TaxID=1648182 RepID=A0ABY5PV30_9ACTN|nr:MULTISPECIES: hypothetical protein [Streptomyces]MBZ9595389.1 hypothetical protein [Streptomyces erythrochromogenes]UUY47403.1 hypothetical protein NRK68_09345 [Streptomyces yangpuensis]